ncbi:hypothetical protein CCYA_CCYA16G4205 [Cyanidiococcus yangmingshanensis]|nr:hypothetical protein CCYA_CCYA16G4205 [Cyanidiococcus yangmingshanensis]
MSKADLLSKEAFRTSDSNQRRGKHATLGKDATNKREKRACVRSQPSPLDGAIASIKPLFEEMRQKSTSKERKQILIDEVLEKLEHSLVWCARRHDAARVVEIALKHGSSEQRGRIWSALTLELARLVETRYGQHVIRALVQYGTGAQRRALISSLRESLVRLATTQDGANIVDYVYQSVANGQERRSLLLSLLVHRDRGLRKMLAKRLEQPADLNGNALDWLLGMLEQPFHRRLIECCRQQLEQVYDKPRVLSNALVHEFLWTMLSSERLEPREKREIGQEFASRALYLYHTNSGSAALILLIQMGDTKWRKECVKAFREVLPEVWNSKYGHRVILALFTWTDDTVMLSKGLVRPLLPKLGQIFSSTTSNMITPLVHAHVPFLYLLAGETTRYFHPTSYNCVWSPRVVSVETVAPKKESLLRRQEVLESISEALFELALAHGAALLCDCRASPRLGALFVELCLYWDRQSQSERISRALSNVMNEASWEALEARDIRQQNELFHQLNILGKLLPDTVATYMKAFEPRLARLAAENERAGQLYELLKNREIVQVGHSSK